MNNSTIVQEIAESTIQAASEKRLFERYTADFAAKYQSKINNLILLYTEAYVAEDKASKIADLKECVKARNIASFTRRVILRGLRKLISKCSKWKLRELKSLTADETDVVIKIILDSFGRNPLNKILDEFGARAIIEKAQGKNLSLQADQVAEIVTESARNLVKARKKKVT